MNKLYLLLLLTLLFTSCDKESDSPAPLTISSISPETGPVGTAVTITGTGFSTALNENEVIINNKPARVTAATPTSLTVVIPARAGSGKFIIRAKGKTAESSTFDHVVTATVTTLAGSTRGFADGTGTNAMFSEIPQIAVAPDGSLYVTDQSNDKIRKITPSGVVSTFAGSTRGHTDGVGTGAQFTIPSGIVLGSNGIFYVTDFHTIRTITADGTVNTLAGSTSGSADGTGTNASFSGPFNVTRSLDGNLFITDTYNHKVRKITPDGTVSTLAGSEAGYADGPGAQARFLHPRGITIGKEGNLYVVDLHYKIRKITPEGVVSTIAGGEMGDADGNVTTAQFNDPFSLAIAPDGTMYIADSDNHRIRMISPDGKVTTLAGSEKGYIDGTGTQAKFHWPSALALASDSVLYVSEVGNYKIRKILLR